MITLFSCFASCIDGSVTSLVNSRQRKHQMRTSRRDWLRVAVYKPDFSDRISTAEHTHHKLKSEAFPNIYIRAAYSQNTPEIKRTVLMQINDTSLIFCMFSSLLSIWDWTNITEMAVLTELQIDCVDHGTFFCKNVSRTYFASISVHCALKFLGNH